MARKKQTFTDQLRAAVEAQLAARGMTRADLSRAAKIDRAVMTRFLQGRAGMRLAALDRLARALDLRVAVSAKRKDRL